MSTNNHVYKVLVTKGDQPMLPAGGTVDTLAPGQVGMFDKNTDLAIDGTTPVRNFYLAVGLDPLATGATTNIAESAGQEIQTRNVTGYTFRPHTPAVAQVFELKNYIADCDTEYGIAFEMRNMDVYKRQGFIQFRKPFFITTPCCEKCADCPSGDANDISILMKAAVNADPAKLVTAIIIARTAITAATHGTAVDYAIGAEVSDADVEALKVWNALPATITAGTQVYTDLRFTTSPLAVQTFCSINLGYKKPRNTTVIPFTVEGFTCKGAFTITEKGQAEEGLGYDIQQKEYHATAWDESGVGPYVLSESTGVAKAIPYQAVATAQYDQFMLAYDQFSVSGWQEHLNNLATIIAVPSVDTATRDSIVAFLDAQLNTMTGFHPLADDVALANVDPTVSEPTAAIDDENKDGIA